MVGNVALKALRAFIAFATGQPPVEPLVAAMPPLRGGTISALAVVFFNGAAPPIEHT